MVKIGSICAVFILMAAAFSTPGEAQRRGGGARGGGAARVNVNRVNVNRGVNRVNVNRNVYVNRRVGYGAAAVGAAAVGAAAINSAAPCGYFPYPECYYY